MVQMLQVREGAKDASRRTTAYTTQDGSSPTRGWNRPSSPSNSLEKPGREKENKDAHKPKEEERDGTESRTALLGTWTRPRTKNGRVLVDSMTTKDGEFGDVSSLWVDGGRGTGDGGWKGEKESKGSWSGGHRRAEGGRAADGDQWAPTLLSDQDRALDGGPWRGSGTVGRTVQWLSGWEMGTKGWVTGCGPPKLSRNQDDGLLLLSVLPPFTPQVGSGPGWDGIGCPQALAPSRNPFVSERKRRQQCL